MAKGRRSSGTAPDRREVDRLSADLDPSPFDVDLEVIDDEPPSTVGRPARRSEPLALHASQDGPDAGDELARAERLRDVVVGADTEADQDIGLVVASGEHDDGHGSLGLDATAHLQPVETGKQEIEHDDVGGDATDEVDTLRAVVRDIDVEALAA